ncbi:hypothetical protein GH714_010824 [Hevea brasiliensis]|uniref:Uncharacterized protein n=1 Tax=Hevea brasiliensis TaxID=3981 RepID=A0A6A6MD95_HEVBR|nr:hypothetical protein GH714_010824 [Hevea brasiliensis]
MSNETGSSGERVLVNEAMYRDAVAAQFERLTLEEMRDDMNRILEGMRRDREERARGRDDARDRRQEVRNIGEPRVENLEGEVHVEEEIEEEFEVGNYNYGGRGYRPPRGRGARGRRGRLPRFGEYRYGHIRWSWAFRPIVSFGLEGMLLRSSYKGWATCSSVLWVPSIEFVLPKGIIPDNEDLDSRSLDSSFLGGIASSNIQFSGWLSWEEHSDLLNWPNHLKPCVLVRWQPSSLQMPGWLNVGVTCHLVGADVAHLGDVATLGADVAHSSDDCGETWRHAAYCQFG